MCELNHVFCWVARSHTTVHVHMHGSPHLWLHPVGVALASSVSQTVRYGVVKGGGMFSFTSSKRQ